MTSSPDLAEVAQAFRRFGEVECRLIPSPLYEVFSLSIADDPEMLTLAAAGRAGQPPPNLIYAATHYLLLEGVEHPLRAYYPDLTPSPQPPAGAYPVFREFCFQHEDQVRELISTRSVQTNVVRRSVCLLPAFAVAAEMGGGRPLAQIEVGASAGLNLLWDRYRYTYGSQPAQAAWGSAASPVSLTTELRGPVSLPPIPPSLRPHWSAGIDLNPVSLSDEDSVAWLRALVWPENVELARQLAAAIEVAREHPPRVEQGDAVRLLPELLAQAPPDATLCVFATHALYQFPHDDLIALLKTMQSYSQTRPVFFIGMEGTADPHSELRLTAYEAGARTTLHLANCHPHGYWLEWLSTA